MNAGVQTEQLAGKCWGDDIIATVGGTKKWIMTYDSNSCPLCTLEETGKGERKEYVSEQLIKDDNCNWIIPKIINRLTSHLPRKPGVPKSGPLLCAFDLLK